MTDIFHKTGKNWISSLEDAWEDVISETGNLNAGELNDREHKLVALGDFLSNTSDNIVIRATIDGVVINGGSYPVKVAGDYVQFHAYWKALYTTGSHTLKIQVRPVTGQTITMEQGIVQVIKE